MARLLYCLLFLSLLVVPLQAQEHATNHCQDAESWQEWDEHLKAHPDDQEFQVLHALRLGLCLKVERGDLSVEDATAMFEQARNTLLQKRQGKPQSPQHAPSL